MSTIFILGGYGYTGKLLVRHLLARTNVEIIVSGRNLEKAKTFADFIVKLRCLKTAVRE